MPRFKPSLSQAVGIVLLGLSTMPASAADPERNGPSFDCRRASSQVEKTICASSALSSLDGQIGIRYGALRAGLDKRSADKLKEDQQTFVYARDATFAGASAQDRASMLMHRLAFLNAMRFSEPPGIEGTWRNAEGEVEITRQPSGSLAFHANAAEPATGNWVCEVAGGLKQDGASQWIVMPIDPEGELKLARNGAALEVQERADRSSPFCGLNGSLAGSYFRTGGSKSTAATGK